MTAIWVGNPEQRRTSRSAVVRVSVGAVEDWRRGRIYGRLRIDGSSGSCSGRLLHGNAHSEGPVAGV